MGVEGIRKIYGPVCIQRTLYHSACPERPAPSMAEPSCPTHIFPASKPAAPIPQVSTLLPASPPSGPAQASKLRGTGCAAIAMYIEARRAGPCRPKGSLCQDSRERSSKKKPQRQTAQHRVLTGWFSLIVWTLDTRER